MECLENNRIEFYYQVEPFEGDDENECVTVFDQAMSEWTSTFLNACSSMSMERLSDDKMLALMNYAFNNCKEQKTIEKNIRQYAKETMDRQGIKYA